MKVGLELELLAPPGLTRDDLARALARELGGAVTFGWKYHGAGALPDGRPDCRLTSAARVEVKGKWFASFVDDPTLRDDLPERDALSFAARTDDVRLAAFIERRCWHRDARQRLHALTTTFDARETEEGLVDPWGLPLVRWHVEPAERARVCEVVLRPLADRERPAVLRRVMRRAAALGFTVPLEAAVHAHFDAAPFRSTRALRRLVLEWSAEWRARFEPNPRCRKLGPFPEPVRRVAREASDDDAFEVIAAGVLLAGLGRELDLNLLGLVERFPRHPTVEVRCLPGSLDAEATLQRLALAETFLRQAHQASTSARRRLSR